MGEYISYADSRLENGPILLVRLPALGTLLTGLSWESPVSDQLHNHKVYAQVSVQTPLQKRPWHIVGISLG